MPALPARVLGKTDTKVGWALSVPDPLARHQIVGCSSAKSGPIISNDVYRHRYSLNPYGDKKNVFEDCQGG